MRVALVIERLDPVRGGRERSTVEVARLLVARGCAVDVVCMEGRPVGDGVELVALGRAGMGRAMALRRFVAAARKHTADGYDVVHAMTPLPGATVYQLRGGTVPGVREAHIQPLRGLRRFVRTLTWPANQLRARQRRLERQVMRDHATMCLPVSQLVADEIARFYGRTENVHVVFNGVTPPMMDRPTRRRWRAAVRREWGIGEESLVFVCPAMNFSLKGVGPTIEAFARFATGARDARLVVLGRDDPQPYRQLAESLDVAPRVQLRGPVDDIWPVYAAADAAVLLSWYDPCSRVVLEATSFGLPCVTTRLNGASEALADGAGLVVARPDEVGAVADALAALADPARRGRCIAACHATAPRLTMARHVDELLAVYEEIARP